MAALSRQGTTSDEVLARLREQQGLASDLARENTQLTQANRELFAVSPRVMGNPERTAVAGAAGLVLGAVNSAFQLNHGVAEAFVPAVLSGGTVLSRLFLSSPDALEASQSLVDSGLTMVTYVAAREGVDRVRAWISSLGSPAPTP